LTYNTYFRKKTGSVLELFRSGSFSSHLFLMIYIIALYARPLTSGWLPITEGEVTFVWSILNQLKQSLPYAFMAFQIIIVFASASLISSIIPKNKMSNSNDLIPGVFFVLISHMSLQMIAFSEWHLAMFFAILGIRALLLVDIQKNNPFQVFNVGFYLSLSGLIYAPWSWLLLLFFISFLLIQPIQSRQYFQLLIGYFTPIFLQTVISISFWKEPFQGVHTLNLPFTWFQFLEEWRWHYGIILGLSGTLFCLLFAVRGRIFSKKNVLIRRKMNVFYFLMASVPFLFFVQQRPQWESLTLIAPFQAILLSLFLHNIKNKLSGELIHILLLGTLLFLHYFLRV
jgi:hypothetical protein